jgi:hypothetical protein
MMARVRMISLAAAVLALAVTSGTALAQGGHRGGGGEKGLFILAHAAGLTGSQIHAAFKADTNLATDRTNLKTANQALTACLVSGADCSAAGSTYLTAKQALAQEQLSVWQGLFKGNPNPANATVVLGQLQQLQQARKALFQQVFASGGGSAE